MRLESSVYIPLRFENRYPIIFLHAMLDNRRTWDFVGPKIAHETGRIVYYLDARNHGDSPWTWDFTIQLMADDVMEFINIKRIPKAILVGHNIGGSVAMKLALEAPHLVEKLVVESMKPEPYPPHGWRIMLEAIQRLRLVLTQMHEGSNSIAAHREALRFMANQTGLLAVPMRADNEVWTWEANLDAIETAISTDTNLDGGLTGTYRGAALFLFGATCTEIWRNQRIHDLFPGVIRFLVQGSRFTPHGEMPLAFVRKVVEFINS